MSAKLLTALSELQLTFTEARRYFGEVGSRDMDIVAWNTRIDLALQAINTTREALAAAEAPTVAQPVAWLYWHPRDDTYDGPDTARKIAVSRFTDDTRRAMSLDGWLFEPLYRAAPPQPVPLPQTQAQTSPLGVQHHCPFCLNEFVSLTPVPVPLTDARIADIGFRFDGEKQVHIPTVLLEFEPVPVNSPDGNISKGWVDRDTFARAIERAHRIGEKK